MLLKVELAERWGSSLRLSALARYWENDGSIRAAERIGLTLQRCRWLSADVIMVLVGLICGITLFVEVGVVLLIPLAFSIAKKTNTSLLKLAIPLCTALMAVHCVVPHIRLLYMLPISWAQISVR